MLQIKPGVIEAHPSELTILVHYEVSQPCTAACCPAHGIIFCAFPDKTAPSLKRTTQVQEVNMLPDGTQEVMSREASEKK